MASIKLKFRPSSQEGKEGVLYYQVIHDRIVRQLKTDMHILSDEWNERKSELAIRNNGRTDVLVSYREQIIRDKRRLEQIASKLEAEHKCSADAIVKRFVESSDEACFFSFMESVIAQLRKLNKTRTSETYTSTLSSFMNFRNGKDLPHDEITSDLMMEYEAWLKGRDVSMNTSSFYMRILRAVYNRAVERGLTENRTPFKHVYTGIYKTVKRALSWENIKRIKALDLSGKPSLDLARTIFLFSFYTRGMSFVDIAYLKKKDLQNGTLTYRRRKTGQQLFIKWEKPMQEIIDKYPVNDTPYLLPIIKKTENERSQYRNALHTINDNLKKVAELAGLQTNLTLYAARHSWASIAKSKNIPISVISEGMGHDSESTTQIYLASLDNSLIDKANAEILKNL